MRTFGTEIDNLIDTELAYGTNNYEITWFQNGLQRDITAPKATLHFTGAKTPLGNVTIDYLELNTDYLYFLEEDEIRIDITEGNSTLTVGTYYVAPGFTKNKYDASYTAYSSLIDLGLKLDAWSEAPESATIGTIVHHFIDMLGIEFDVEPISNITFNASMMDFSAITLGELLGYCACIEKCNYVLRGNTLYKVVTATDITKEYNIDDVVYTENLWQNTSDTTLDYIKINYKTVIKGTDEDGQPSYEFNDASYICKDGAETHGFELNIGLIPTSESALQSYFSNYFTSVKGMDCNGYNISFLGDARVEVGDKLKFLNNTDSAVLNVVELTWEWDGALKCTVSSGSESSNSTESGFSIQQVVSQINAMTNAVKNVQFNAVYTNELYAKVAMLGFASIGELTAEVAKMGLLTADQADIRYASIDFANIEDAALTRLFANTGILKDVTIKDGAVTGTLDAVKINGDSIITNTLAVKNLILEGTDGLIYQINALASGLSKTELSEDIYSKKLNGTDIVANSVTAEQIKSSTITANELDINNIFGNKAVINRLTSTEAFINALNTNSIIVGANSSAENALKTVEELYNRANAGEFKGEKGDTGATGAAGPKGDTGKGVKSIVEQYYLSTSNTAQAGGSWVNACPVWVNKKYIWIRQYITWSDNTTTTTTPTLANAINSANQYAYNVDIVIAAWCYNNDKTYINGGKLYTGTVTAEKLNVKTLSSITADIGTVTAGVIKSKNYVENSTGMKIDLSTGAWDSKYTKLSAAGILTIKDAIVNGNIESNGELKLIGGSGTGGTFVANGSKTNLYASYRTFSSAQNISVLSTDNYFISQKTVIGEDDVIAGLPGSGDEVSLKGLKPELLWTGNLTASTTVNVNNTLKLSNAVHDIIVLCCNCANLRQNLIFFRGDSTEQFLFDFSSSTANIRGGYSVDWANSQIRARYLKAQTFNNTHVAITRVYGIGKK